MEFAVLVAMLAALVSLAASYALAAAARAKAARDERQAWESKTARRVVVALKSGAAVDGVLVDASARMLTIREAVLHAPGSDNPAPIDGSVLVLWDEVEYMQYPTAE